MAWLNSAYVPGRLFFPGSVWLTPPKVWVRAPAWSALAASFGQGAAQGGGEFGELPLGHVGGHDRQ
ncbi:hypothetical protein ACNPQM_22085 [Streptomyces sp. NPDC056231]|uniref:hypothetical protein n=1 Tax=Streptomyces sp. NPDC056231 TaxID=3345755 RepID=UPI003AAAA033